VSVVRFKFRCNIIISGKIIKEMPDSVTKWDTLYKVTLRGVFVIIVAIKRAISITYSEYVFVAVGIRHESACSTLLYVACLILQYFSGLFHK